MSLLIIALFALLAEATSTPIMGHQGRIVGGDMVFQQQLAPYMASLRSSTVHFCGGTIVSTRHILTSAQCTNGRAGNSITVVVGTVQRTANGVPYLSSSIFAHPGFDRKTLDNDIALVMTAIVIVITPGNVEIASINRSLFVSDVSATLYGWGATLNEIDPFQLHMINTSTISNEQCQLEQSLENEWRVTDNKICTAVDQRTAICYGDEGGALVSDNAVIGVASFHSHCSVDLPNIYERVGPHHTWIQSIIIN